jgi:hypothetical protein
MGELLEPNYAGKGLHNVPVDEVASLVVGTNPLGGGSAPSKIAAIALFGANYPHLVMNWIVYRQRRRR